MTIEDSSTLMQFAIQLYAELASYAIPVAFAIGMCNVIINTFFAAAFGGKLRIGGEK